MNPLQKIQQESREKLRWRTLKTVDACGPTGLREKLLLQVVVDLAFAATPEQLRETLEYLAGKRLLTLDKNLSQWKAIITPEGTDVIEGNAPCPPGIACEV